MFIANLSGWEISPLFVLLCSFFWVCMFYLALSTLECLKCSSRQFQNLSNKMFWFRMFKSVWNPNSRLSRFRHCSDFGYWLYCKKVQKLNICLVHYSDSHYANDAYYFFKRDNWEQTKLSTAKRMPKIVHWLIKSGMFVNVSKTEACLIETKKSEPKRCVNAMGGNI